MASCLRGAKTQSKITHKVERSCSSSPPSIQPVLPTSLLHPSVVSQKLIQRLKLSHREAQNSDIRNLDSRKAQGSGQNLELPCPTHVPKGEKPSVCVAPKKFTGWCEKQVSFCILSLHIQWKKKPVKAAILQTRYRSRCSRKLAQHHTPSVCSSSPSYRSVIVLETGHQQTQQNNNAQGTISSTGPWEGPAEFL